MNRRTRVSINCRLCAVLFVFAILFGTVTARASVSPLDPPEPEPHVYTYIDGYDGSEISSGLSEEADYPPAPSHAGASFEGWISGGEYRYVASYRITETVYVDGLTGDILSEKVPLYHEGYITAGWESESQTESIREGLTKDTVTETIMYTVLPQYTVTFVDGVTEEVIMTQLVYAGYAASLPEAPQHEGYTFLRWFGSWVEVEADTTVTAEYDPTNTHSGDEPGEGQESNSSGGSGTEDVPESGSGKQEGQDGPEGTAPQNGSGKPGGNGSHSHGTGNTEPEDTDGKDAVSPATGDISFLLLASAAAFALLAAIIAVRKRLIKDSK